MNWLIEERRSCSARRPTRTVPLLKPMIYVFCSSNSCGCRRCISRAGRYRCRIRHWRHGVGYGPSGTFNISRRKFVVCRSVEELFYFEYMSRWRYFFSRKLFFLDWAPLFSDVNKTLCKNADAVSFVLLFCFVSNLVTHSLGYWNVLFFFPSVGWILSC